MSLYDESHTLQAHSKEHMTTLSPDTPMQQFYSGSNIFITGGSGFMGKVLIEKLLRCFPDVDNIYLLMREKKGCCGQKRMDAIFNDELFSKLSGLFPKYRSKVHAVIGDCSQPGLGLSEDERHLLIHKVDIVFHGAATVRFDEPLRRAVAINVDGTRGVLSLAKQMKKLKAIVHLSTAYSNCPKPEINEEFYDPPMSDETLTNLVNSTSDELLERFTPIVLGKWPNTYTLTKAMAEDLIRQEGSDLPIVIFRPSIVVGIKDEPLPGWVGNFNGPSGMAVASGIGLVKSVHCDPNAIADCVPVDMAINAMLAAAWDVGTNTEPTTTDNIAIYNYVSSVQNPIRNHESYTLATTAWLQIPALQSYWYPSVSFTTYYWIHWLRMMMFHFLPALLIDAASFTLGKKPRLWKLFTEINNRNHALSYFMTRSWKFSNRNVQALWLKLSEEDKNNFMFDMKQLKWSVFVHDFIRGCRVYLLKDDMSTVPQALVRHIRLYWVHHAAKTVLSLILLRATWFVLSI